VARIAHDRPDILERMKAGEFTSAREAARAAGIVKQTSPVQQVLHLWQKATPEERQLIRQFCLILGTVGLTRRKEPQGWGGASGYLCSL
jgi:hypothetical protein